MEGDLACPAGELRCRKPDARLGILLSNAVFSDDLGHFIYVFPSAAVGAT